MFGFGKRKDLYGSLFGTPLAPLQPEASESPASSAEPPVIAMSALIPAPMRFAWDNGTKFPGGYGETEILFTDYWTLRARSAELFKRNIYARGIVRRLLTNEINTGLNLEVTPEEALLGLEEDALADWSETVENRFSIWSEDATLCDLSEQHTFGALQATARMEALIDGDLLAVLRQDQRTGLPRVQLISGGTVQTPWPVPDRPGARIVEGVELDSLGRHVAYWIRQRDGSSKRLPAWGEKSGRRLAWLVYGTERRLTEVRGTPLLGIVLQSLKEIDRYRDSTQRKATLNSFVAMFLKKTEDRPGSRPVTMGALRRGAEVVDPVTGGAPRSFRTAELMPGMVIEELQMGEEPVPYSTHGTDERFGSFESAIIQAIAWVYEIPPEILTLSFSSNYSASQAAINEFKMYLHKIRTWWGKNFCQPVYVDWLLSEVLARRIDAPRLLEAWRDPLQFDRFGAWTASDWSGHIKPAVDPSKLVNGYKTMIEEGFITRDRASRELTGMKHSKVVARLKRENRELYEANAWLIKPSANPAAAPDPDKDDAEDVPAKQRNDGNEAPQRKAG